MNALHIRSLFRKKQETGQMDRRRGISGTQENIVLAMLITAIATVALWIIFPPHFTETNDDMIMASFAYGYMGEYTDKLVFINVIIGKILRFLIQLFPHVPWYALSQCAIIYASFTVIVFLMLQKFGKKKAAILIAFVFAFFGYEFFSSLQFTKTAATAVTAGMLLLFYGVSESRKWYTYLIGGLLTLLGSLYRFRIFEMLLLLLFGVGLVLVWKPLRKKQWMELLKICLPFVLVLSMCFGAYIFDRWTYGHSQGWEDFWDYNYLRDNLQNSREDADHTNGFPDYSENQELYESLNITENDYNLYCTSNFADTELFTKDVIKTLVEAKGNKPVNVAFFRSFFTVIGKGIISYNVFPALCIALLAGALSACGKRRDKLFLLLYEVAVFVGIQLYFFYRGRYLQSRTDVSVIFATVAILIFYTLEFESLLPTKRKTAVLLAGACMISAVPSHVALREQDRAEREYRTDTEVHELMSSDMDHFYLCFTNWNNFPDKMYDIWHVAEKGCGKNRSALGTWRVSTPTVIDKMEQYDITNPYRDLIDNDSVYLLCVANQNLNQVLTHIRVHYNQDAYAYQVKSIEGHYPIYRIATGEPQLDTSLAVDATDSLHYDLTRWEQDGLLYMDGYLYADDTNSFASNIYVGITGPDGTETFYYTTQYQSSFTEDNMNGEYGSFTRGIPMPEEGSVLNLYLETEDGLYVVPNWYAMPDI